MNVLVATADSQGAAADDFCWTIEGELVWFPPSCDDTSDECGCRRSFGGLASHRATTTAKIVHRDDLSFVEFARAILDSVVAQGYGPAADVRTLAIAQAVVLRGAAGKMEPGAVLERRDEFLRRRFHTDEFGWLALRSDRTAGAGPRPRRRPPRRRD
jgi:hypothetical protein